MRNSPPTSSGRSLQTPNRIRDGRGHQLYVGGKWYGPSLRCDRWKRIGSGKIEGRGYGLAISNGSCWLAPTRANPLLRVNSGETVDSMRIPIGLLIIQQAWACQVPVFRYALERWKADDYHAVTIHQGALNEEQKAFESTRTSGRSTVRKRSQFVFAQDRPLFRVVRRATAIGNLDLPSRMTRHGSPCTIRPPREFKNPCGRVN